jgi:hypothetical protein
MTYLESKDIERRNIKMLDKIWNIIFTLLQFSWGLIQTFIGLIVYIIVKILKKAKEELNYKGAHITVFGNNWGGISLGKFIFICSGYTGIYKANTLAHEWGHTIQSLILGPLYLIAVGIPSSVWNLCFKKYRKENKIDYYSFFCEKWADIIGNVNR